ncbi:hypothetical protein [Sphingomonas daechungensis]|nr:hypothetical protein [Sphingomonas daechungensis]
MLNFADEGPSMRQVESDTGLKVAPKPAPRRRTAAGGSRKTKPA